MKKCLIKAGEGGLKRCAFTRYMVNDSVNVCVCVDTDCNFKNYCVEKKFFGTLEKNIQNKPFVVIEKSSGLFC